MWRFEPRADLDPERRVARQVLLDRDGVAYMVVFPAEATTLLGPHGWVVALQTDSLPADGDRCVGLRCNRSGSDAAWDSLAD